MYWTQTKLQWGGKETWPKCWIDVQSAVSPCKNPPPTLPTPPPSQCISSLNMGSVAANNQKRQIVTAVFPSQSPLRFFFFWGGVWGGRQRRQGGEMDREKPHHITTPQALMETCRLLGDRSTHGLRLPWEPGYMASRTDTYVFAFAQVWMHTDRYVSTTKREGWKRRNLSCLHPSPSLWSRARYFYLPNNLYPQKEKRKSRGGILKRKGLSW